MTDAHTTVEDDLGRAARLAFAVAAQSADRLARARADLAAHTQAHAEREYRQLEARFRTEASIAGTRLAAVQRPHWWDRAGVSDVARMHELAQQWRDVEPRAAAAADTIHHEVRTRYGIDTTDPGADPSALRAALARLDLERAAATVQRTESGLAAAARGVAAVAAADQRDARAARPEVPLDSSVQAQPHFEPAREAQVGERTVATVPYDSAQRRQASADEMRAHGVLEESIAVAMRADIARGKSIEDVMATARNTRVVPGSTGIERAPHAHRADRSR